MVKSSDLIAVTLNVKMPNGNVEPRKMYVQKGMRITLDDKSVYDIKNDGVYAGNKKIADIRMSASEYSIISGVGLTSSEGLPENKKDGFVLTQEDINAAYNARHEEYPRTQNKINDAQSQLETGESVFMRDAYYKCQPNEIEITAKTKPEAGGGTTVSIFMNK